MSSLRDQILAAKYAALNDAGRPAGLTVARGRVDPFAADELPAMNVRPARQLPYPHAPGRSDPRLSRKHLVLAVDVFAAGEPFDVPLDPLLAWAVSAVMADPRTVVDGAALTVGVAEHETEWHAPAALNQTYGGATVFFLVDYVQAAANPAAHA